MRKGILGSLAGLCIAGGMAMAQSPYASSAAPNAQPVKDAPPLGATPTILTDSKPGSNAQPVKDALPLSATPTILTDSNPGPNTQPVKDATPLGVTPTILTDNNPGPDAHPVKDAPPLSATLAILQDSNPGPDAQPVKDAPSLGATPTILTDSNPGPDAQPVKDAPPFSATPAILQDCNPGCADRCGCGPPGRFWVSAEYLYWWTKDSRLPPLVTGGSTADATPGAFGQPGTRVLFGGDIDSEGQSGGRFDAGFWLNERQTIGFEAGYFFLGSRTNSFITGGSGAPGSPVITRPFVDIPPTGAAPFQNSEVVAFPGVAAGVISVQSTSNLQGAAPNGLFNLCCCDNCCGGRRIDLIGGFRWMELNESVTISEDITPSANPGSSFPAGGHITVIDQFSTQNDFYGPQIGVRGEWWRDRFFVNARTLVALGTTHQQVTINGTTIFTPAVGAPTVESGGLLALPSNIGRYSRDKFSVVPEVGVNVGYQITPHLRAFAGYTFIYWSNVVRPGDAIDTGVNPSQLPTSSGPGPLVGPARPAFQFHDSGFWAQGINVGVELRF